MIIEQVREVGMLDFITAKSGAFDTTKARASSFRAATYLPVHCIRLVDGRMLCNSSAQLAALTKTHS